MIPVEKQIYSIARTHLFVLTRLSLFLYRIPIIYMSPTAAGGVGCRVGGETAGVWAGVGRVGVVFSDSQVPVLGLRTRVL